MHSESKFYSYKDGSYRTRLTRVCDSNFKQRQDKDIYCQFGSHFFAKGNHAHYEKNKLTVIFGTPAHYATCQFDIEKMISIPMNKEWVNNVWRACNGWSLGTTIKIGLLPGYIKSGVPDYGVEALDGNLKVCRSSSESYNKTTRSTLNALRKIPNEDFVDDWEQERLKFLQSNYGFRACYHPDEIVSYGRFSQYKIEAISEQISTEWQASNNLNYNLFTTSSASLIVINGLKIRDFSIKEDVVALSFFKSDKPNNFLLYRNTAAEETRNTWDIFGVFTSETNSTFVFDDSWESSIMVVTKNNLKRVNYSAFPCKVFKTVMCNTCVSFPPNMNCEFDASTQTCSKTENQGCYRCRPASRRRVKNRAGPGVKIGWQ